jgi:hypothetical protein
VLFVIKSQQLIEFTKHELFSLRRNKTI